MNNQPISIAVQCKDNPDCRYKGENIPIVVSIKNNLSENIQIPIAFEQKTGPGVRLIDARSKKSTHLRTNLADFELLKNWTTIPAGQSANLTWVIYDSELEQFGNEFIDITAEVTIVPEVRIGTKEGHEKVKAVNSIRITGKSKTVR